MKDEYVHRPHALPCHCHCGLDGAIRCLTNQASSTTTMLGFTLQPKRGSEACVLARTVEGIFVIHDDWTKSRRRLSLVDPLYYLRLIHGRTSSRQSLAERPNPLSHSDGLCCMSTGISVS